MTIELNDDESVTSRHYTDLTGIILAGGIGKRLGYKNKALLTIGRLSIIERVICAISELTRRIVVITNSPDELRHLKLPLYRDFFPGSGPLGGIYTGLRISEAHRNIVIACDMPFIQPRFLRFLVDESEGYDLVLPLASDGYHPLCAIYSKECAKHIETLIKTEVLKVTNLFHFVKVKKVDPELLYPAYDPNILFNINTNEDYLRALSIGDEQILYSEQK